MKLRSGMLGTRTLDLTMCPVMVELSHWTVGADDNAVPTVYSAYFLLPSLAALPGKRRCMGYGSGELACLFWPLPQGPVST